MAQSHFGWFSKQPDVEVRAVCDVDRRRLDGMRQHVGKDCGLVSDFRDLLAQPGIDAVVIATPDHWHGLIAVAAAQAGKHIYCEKPLTNSIAEGRAVCTAVSKAGVVLQTGSQERTNPGAGIAKQLIQSGRLGEIKHVRIQLPIEDPHLKQVAGTETPPPDQPTPDGLDFDFWLGPAPKAPYNEFRCHFWWRFHSDYGGGEMTDRGAHVIDLAQMILGRDDTGPVSYQATGRPGRCSFYDAVLDFEFENTYADGLKMTGDNRGPRGVKFEGTEGSLFVAVHGAALTAEPASLLEGIEVPPAGHHDPHRRGFVDAVKTGAPVIAPAEAGHRTATICHLNNIAMRLGRPFRWDPAVERADDDEVNAMLAPPMRQPWSLAS